MDHFSYIRLLLLNWIMCCSCVLIFHLVYFIDLQVFGAMQQAVLRAPFSSLAHNLLGLVCESRTDYQSAVIAYQQARYILKNFPCFEGDVQAHFVDVSVNLARSLCKVNSILFCLLVRMNMLCSSFRNSFFV